MERVISYINNNGSKEHPICNKEISKAIGVGEVEIRKLINKARCNGYAICSCDKGYFMSEDVADILDTIESLTRRTSSINNAVSGLITALKCLEADADD